MNCSTSKCSTSEADRQPFPQDGPLTQKKDLALDSIKRLIDPEQEQGTVYCYIIASIKNRAGCFVQTGCGPNFQGGLITLCTCKQFMRTFRDVGDWPGVWIAGFSGIRAGGGENALVYLMKVAYAFKSQYDLWESREIPGVTKQAKTASRDKFGDIYQPRGRLINSERFDPQSYEPPLKNHVHAKDNDWLCDIDCTGCGDRKPALLVGDVKSSFLWEYPKIFYLCPPLHRGQKKFEHLKELLDCRLKEG